jgi:hypothetical protein
MDPTVANAQRYLEFTKDELAKAASFVPEDKLNWRPCETATSTLDIVVECAAGQRMFAAVLLGESVSLEGGPTAEQYPTLCTVTAFLDETSKELSAAMATIGGERLGESLLMPWGGSMPMVAVLHLAGHHNAYHAGQINYIQRLLGDTDFHFGM